MMDQDPELGNLPSYDEATGRKTSQPAGHNSRTPKKLRAGGLFNTLEETCDANAVAFAHISIRMGMLWNKKKENLKILGFLRKVLGILAFQFLLTVSISVALYLTPNVRGFVQNQ